IYIRLTIKRKIMKLEKLKKLKKTKLTKEAMAVTFGGYSVQGTNCSGSYIYIGGPQYDCGDGSLD
ncbi:hypothetical protein, partial [Cloacibacterium sp.]|uniref:hypothetical protein n=2 Tax=Weeksellaceae TaxID=2762318 RepID=UPI00352C8406